jgi:mannose-6-phosphate isomerase
VLRCGLTPKHIDVPELLRITDFVELPEPVWPSTATTDDIQFVVPVPDFALTRIVVDDRTEVAAPGPRLVLCTHGKVRVADVDVQPGHAALVPAELAGATVTGSGTVFVATTGG